MANSLMRPSGEACRSSRHARRSGCSDDTSVSVSSPSVAGVSVIYHNNRRPGAAGYSVYNSMPTN
eukprot:scaffold87835_cov77-Phaeocystis_antarctica.AAC.1